MIPVDPNKRASIAKSEEKDSKRLPPNERKKFNELLGDGKSKQEHTGEIVDNPLSLLTTPDETKRKRKPKDAQGAMQLPYQEVMASNAFEISAEPTQVHPRVQLQDLYKQLVQSITTMDTKNLKEISLELKHPPIFEGAVLTVAIYKYAPKEYNLTLLGLSNEAKQLLDMEKNRDRLLAHMQEKGFVIHIFVTSTEEAPALIPPEKAPPQEKEREQKEQRDQQRQKKEEEER